MSAVIDIAESVRDLLSRTPEWVRIDLASKDAATRSRAEETLAAMIEATLNQHGSAGASGGAVPSNAGDER